VLQRGKIQKEGNELKIQQQRKAALLLLLMLEKAIADYPPTNQGVKKDAIRPYPSLWVYD
jgi:hypothetical protein